MTEEYRKKLNSLKLEALAEDIDISHCEDDISCIIETIERVRQERSSPSLRM